METWLWAKESWCGSSHARKKQEDFERPKRAQFRGNKHLIPETTTLVWFLFFQFLIILWPIYFCLQCRLLWHIVHANNPMTGPNPLFVVYYDAKECLYVSSLILFLLIRQGYSFDHLEHPLHFWTILRKGYSNRIQRYVKLHW